MQKFQVRSALLNLPYGICDKYKSSWFSLCRLICICIISMLVTEAFKELLARHVHLYRTPLILSHILKIYSRQQKIQAKIWKIMINESILNRVENIVAKWETAHQVLLLPQWLLKLFAVDASKCVCMLERVNIETDFHLHMSVMHS